MADPGRHVLRGQSMVGEESADVVAQVFLGDVRDVDRQHDPEAVTADPPAHDFFGVGVDAAPGRQHPGAATTPAGPITSTASAMAAMAAMSAMSAMSSRI